MTTEEIIQGNKSIAEFCGAILWSGKRGHEPTKYKMAFDGTFPDKMFTCKIADLKYHTSWEWLMPVVEKINELGFAYRIENRKDERPATVYWMWIWEDEEDNPIVSKNAFSLLEATYLAVLSFIHYYNTQIK